MNEEFFTFDVLSFIDYRLPWKLEVGNTVVFAKILDFTLKNFVFLQKSIFCKNPYKIPYLHG